jgi:hypothetical protein
MSKKTLSDLILNFDSSKKSGGFVKKSYVPATKLVAPLGKKVIIPPSTDKQNKVDYKKEYQQLLYKDLYKKTRPHPKDVLEQEDFYKVLANQKKIIEEESGRKLTAKDIEELLGDIGEYKPYFGSESASYVRPQRRPRAPLSELTESNIQHNPQSEYSYNLPFAGSTLVSNYEYGRFQPPYRDEILYGMPNKASSRYNILPPQEDVYRYRMPEEIIYPSVSSQISFNPPEHDYDNEELNAEYENNYANFENMGRPKKAFLPEEEGYETIVFQTAEDPYGLSVPRRIEDWESRSLSSAVSAPVGKRGLTGKSPGSAVGRKKGPAAMKAKAEAKKAASVTSQASLILPSAILPQESAYEERKKIAKGHMQRLYDESNEYFRTHPWRLPKDDLGYRTKEQYDAEQSALLIGKGIMQGVKKLKKKASRGGKISVGNLTKFFKSSYAGKKAPKQIDTYNLDSQLTNKYGSVYYDPDKNHAVLTHKGTSGDTYLESAKDWGNNAAYAMGLYKYTDRYKQGKKLQDATEKKYGAENVSTLGHSQGSHLSRELGGNSKEIINLNAAYKGEKPLKNEYNIRSSGDVVSIGLHGTNRSHDVLIPAASLNPLTEHKIDILDRLDQSQMIGGRRNKKKQ